MKRCKGFSVLVTLAALAGCQTAEQIGSGLSSLEGKSYQAAFDILGFPDAESTIAGKRVFTWGSRNTGSYSVPTFSTSSAYVNGEPIFIQTQGTTTETFDYHCRIDLVVGDTGLIEHAKYDGNIGGCERYARLFARRAG